MGENNTSTNKKGNQGNYDSMEEKEINKKQELLGAFNRSNAGLQDISVICNFANLRRDLS